MNGRVELSAVVGRLPFLALPSGAARRYMLVVLLFALGNSSDAFVVVRMVDLGATVAGALLLLALMNVAYMVLAIPVGQLSDRFGRRSILLGGYVAYAAIYSGFAVISSVQQAVLLILLYGAYYGVTDGISRALLADLSPRAARGGAFGWFHMVTGVGALPASIVAGALWSAFGPQSTFLFGASCALAAAAILLAVQEPPQRVAAG